MKGVSDQSEPQPPSLNPNLRSLTDDFIQKLIDLIYASPAARQILEPLVPDLKVLRPDFTLLNIVKVSLDG